MKTFSASGKRIILYLCVFLAIACWDVYRRRWTPTTTWSTDHYTVQSTCTQKQTQEIGAVAEILYSGYQEFLVQLAVTPQPHGKLRIKLFKDRKEFRLCNRGCGWAEAFYLKPYCCQYYSAEELNPYHWMIHEATHQLNEEAAGLHLAKWLNEGLADYFGSSRIIGKRLVLGEIDVNTYPVWWIETLAVSGNLEADKRNGSVIPLRAIISGSGGPDISKTFNLYYLHWWSLMHFLQHYENGKYRGGVAALVKTDGGVEAFTRHVGDVEQIEREWYGYVRGLKQILPESNGR
jgi:hypothetical protein